MLDAHLVPKLQPVLKRSAGYLDARSLTPNHITVAGFFLGVLAMLAIAFGCYWLGLVLIVLNRIFDGLDGELARLQNSQSQAGGFLDICLDFLFYGGIPVAFAFADPANNALASVVLLFSFIGTGTSFLAFATAAESLALDRPQFKYKSFYYLNGLTEGTETIGFFLAFCVFHEYYATLAYVFSACASMTVLTRIVGGFSTLNKQK